MRPTPTSLTRLLLLGVLLTFALVGRGELGVDLENLSMKSGADAAVNALRDREFGAHPHVLVLVDGPAGGPLEEWRQGVSDQPMVMNARTLTQDPLCLDLTLQPDDEGRYADRVDRVLERARASLPAGHTLSAAGQPPLELAIARAMHAERRWIVPLIGAALALVLLLIHRSVLYTALGLFAPLVGIFVMEGAQGVLGLQLDPISALLGPTLLTIGVAASVHLLERFRLEHAATCDGPAAARSTARALRLPLALAVVTTAAGFLGLATNPIPAVRRFGLLAAVGVALVIGLAWGYVPWALGRFARAPRSTSGDGRLARRTTAWLARARYPVAALTALLILVGLLQQGAARVDSDPLEVLPPNAPARVEAERVASVLGGNDVFELLLPPAEDRAKLTRWMGSLALIERISALPGVAGPAGPPRTSPGGYGLLTFLLTPSGSAERAALFTHAERLAGDAGWADARASGMAVTMARDSNELAGAQRRGAGMTALALFVVMAVGLRSVRLGLFGLVPNVLPVLLIQGWRSFQGEPVTVVSSMIGVVMLGLVVDDTIHWLHAYRKAHGTPAARVVVAQRHVARAITITTAVLSIGFVMTAFGELLPTREFGQLAVATLFIAFVADLVCLPALLLAASGRTRLP